MTRNRSRERDRDLVYESENQLYHLIDTDTATISIAGSTLVVPSERRFGDIASMQRYTSTVLRLPGVRRRWPRVSRDLEVVGVRYGREARYDPATRRILVPTHGIETSTSWAMRELVLAHEIAHHLERDGHGPRWRGALCFLLEDCVAPEAAFILRFLMSENGLAIVDPAPSGVQDAGTVVR